MMRAKSIFKSIQQALLICNKEGKIVYFNDAYADFINKKLEEVAGLPIKQIRPGTAIPNVLHSGKPRENMYRIEGEQEYYANVYPVIENNRVTGTISIVTTIDKEKLKARPKKTLQQRVREFEKKEIEEMLFIYGYDTNGKKAVAKELGISLATLYNKLSY